MATMRVFESGGCKTLKRTCIDETSKGNVDSPTPSVIYPFFIVCRFSLFILVNYTGSGVSSWQRCESLSREGARL
jgi:hypothetical protein